MVVVLNLRGVLGTVPMVVEMVLNKWLLFLVYSDGGAAGDVMSLIVAVVDMRGFGTVVSLVAIVIAGVMVLNELNHYRRRRR